MSRPQSYSALQIALHWIIAALVIYQLFLHEDIERAHHALGRGVDPGLWNIHVIVGLSVLALVTARIILRFTHGTPPSPENEPSIFRLLAAATHWAFYGLLFILPLSGIMIWFFNIHRAEAVHEIGKNLILALLALHILAALAHHFLFKSNVLMRMLGRS